MGKIPSAAGLPAQCVDSTIRLRQLPAEKLPAGPPARLLPYQAPEAPPLDQQRDMTAGVSDVDLHRRITDDVVADKLAGGGHGNHIVDDNG